MINRNSEATPLYKGMKYLITDTFTLEEGQVSFQYPIPISEDNFEDLESWIELMLKKIKRISDENKNHE